MPLAFVGSMRSVFADVLFPMPSSNHKTITILLHDLSTLSRRATGGKEHSTEHICKSPAVLLDEFHHCFSHP
jgi:hypothetical protein